MEDFWPVPTQAMARARALVAFRSQPGFEQLIVGQKRVANILRGLDVAGRPEPDALVEPTERLLWQESQALEPALDEALAASAYDKAFELLLGLRSTIDKFFDDVLVMAKDEQVRTNRLRLLACVRSLFRRVADLSRIVLEGEEP
jgi:glycyl-tRNA synthetase beta chain